MTRLTFKTERPSFYLTNGLVHFMTAIWIIALWSLSTATADDLNVLFLGDRGHHQPRVRFAQLQPVRADRGIRLV